MRYLRRQRISNKHNKNNLLPKVKIIFKRSIFIGDEFYFINSTLPSRAEWMKTLKT